MPLPKPREGETHEAWSSRCMASSAMNEEYPDAGQRHAVCEDLWSRNPSARTRRWYAMEITEETAEISIFDAIGRWDFAAKDFKRDFDTVKKSRKLRLLLNSPGGDVFEGMAIYNLLAAYREKLEVEVLGVAASIASVIALAGRELVMAQGSYLMIHNPSGIVMGNAGDMRKTAETLDKIAGQIANIYAGKSYLNREEVLAAMEQESWYTAAEAVEAGFADRVEDRGPIAALAFDLQAFHYDRVPRILASLPAVDGGDEIQNMGGENVKTLNEILVALSKLSKEEMATATDEEKQRVAQIFDFAGMEAKNAGLVETAEALGRKLALQEEQIHLLLTENQEKTRQLEELKRARSLAEKDKVIEKALSEGRITPRNRAQWEAQYDKDPEGTQKLLEAQQPVVDLSARGTGAGGEESDALSEGEGKKILSKMGYSEKQIEGGK